MDSEKYLLLKGIKIPIQLSKGKRNGIRLSFKEISLHIQTNTGTIEANDKLFIEKKTNWIVKHFSNLEKQHSTKETLLKEGENQVRLFGKNVSIEYLVSTKHHFALREGILYLSCTQKTIAHKNLVVKAAIKQISMNYLTQRVKHWSSITELSYTQLRIKSHQSKWGSCSTLRNINLNWRLIFLDKETIDYVIIHEFMHLREMNHGAQFWKWVKKYCPNYKVSEKVLKESQWVMSLFTK